MIKNFLDSDEEEIKTSSKPTQSNVQLLGLSDDEGDPQAVAENNASTTETADISENNETPIEFTFTGAPENKKSSADNLNSAENVRMSGMAYSAAIVLTSSIVFMLMLGWFADLLAGTSPWGIVVGIVLGSIIGFVQFFRITSGIFHPDKPSQHPSLFATTRSEPQMPVPPPEETALDVSATEDKDTSAL